ncbi:homoaconitate hydratase [Patescibacteria group bacterium]|nr:homoaconitate hydratase [Patescibacteria group bacterium]MBU1683081.1 homoaconitate hydratase [Patescibacteria group bacterium]MBU1935158.1 homoaconitate hydratase [Patescibacteria group bacterium]
MFDPTYQNTIFRETPVSLPENIDIYDVTLRDGEQHPNVHFTMKDKLLLVEKMVDFGITMIEGGFPATSQEEFETLQEIITSYPQVKIYAFCRLKKEDIDLAVKSGAKYIVTFIPSSELLLEKKLGIQLDTALERVNEVVRYAKSLGLYVRFGCEDATRTPIARLKKIYDVAVEAGADAIGIADTLGVMTPSSMTPFIKMMCEMYPGIKIAAHCHNDYGLATANTLAAIEAGASRAHTSLCGIGERAGNASFEELITILKYQYNYQFNFKFEKLHELTEALYKIAKIPRPHIKAVCGKHSFTHESGIHVQGLLKDEATYSPFPAQDIGRETQIALGKHSGKANIEFLAKKHKISITDIKTKKALKDLKEGKKIDIFKSRYV